MKYEIDYSLMNEEDYEMMKREYNSNSGKFVILGVNSRNKTKHRSQKLYICKFINTGYEVLAQKSTILDGMIKDIKAKTIWDVGYVDTPKISKDKQLIYVRWTAMLRRVYDKNSNTYHLYGGNGVSVCERWHSFKNFMEDFENIVGYKDCILNDCNKFELDKDIFGEKLYSKETCCIVPQKLNKFFSHSESVSTVKFDRKYNNYKAFYCENSNIRRIGTFETFEEAFILAKEKRIELLTKIFEKYDWVNDNIKEKCYNKIETIYNNLYENREEIKFYG